MFTATSGKPTIRQVKHISSASVILDFIPSFPLSAANKYISQEVCRLHYSALLMLPYPEELLSSMLLVFSDGVQRPRARLVAPDAAQRVVRGHQLHLQRGADLETRSMAYHPEG